MAIESGFETLEAVIGERPRGDKPLCAAETTSGSICRAAPMGNGRCVQHGGRAQLRSPAFDDETLSEAANDPAALGETIDRVMIALDVISSVSAELPLNARQQLVPEIRALAGRALSTYHELLAANRREAAARTGRLVRG